MYNNIARWAGLVVLVVVLAGCIQPAKDDAGPDGATNPPVAPPQGADGAQLPAGYAAQQFVLSRGHTPDNLQVWYEQPSDFDRLQGFSYTNTGGIPCAGFLLSAFTNGVWQPTNGALACASQPVIQVLASVGLFATSSGTPYTIVFGRADDPAISAIGVVYSDGSNANTPTVTGGFLLVKPGIVGANVITAIDSLGYTVIDNIPQTGAS
ncbi:MAG: hypothetical protein JXQ72_10740 [Anaerolineae bacterium]|nr:hypothetical protein [Anaerolineae bacterium]